MPTLSFGVLVSEGFLRNVGVAARWVGLNRWLSKISGTCWSEPPC